MSRVAIIGKGRSGRTGPAITPKDWITPTCGQKVFHEVAGSQVESIQSGNRVELLLEHVQTNHGTGSVWFVRADAA